MKHKHWPFYSFTETGGHDDKWTRRRNGLGGTKFDQWLCAIRATVRLTSVIVEFSIEIIEQKRKQLKSDQQSDQQSDSSSDSSSDSDEHEPTLPDDDSIETLPQIQQPVHIVDTQK